MPVPLLVKIIAYAPTAFYHCTHCEVAWREMGASNRIQEEQLENSLPEDLVRDYRAVSDWVREIFGTYQDRIIVKVIDAASVEGVAASLWHGARRYPAVIITGGPSFSGLPALQEAREALRQRLSGT